MLKSWYMVFFQCPVLPELLAMSEDSAQLNSLLKDAKLVDHQEVVEAYKFAFREYATWNRAINYYRCAASKRSRQWMDRGVRGKAQNDSGPNPVNLWEPGQIPDCEVGR